jgi:cobalamin biosynthesis protein CobW
MLKPQERRLPVTVVTGFLGAGKTTLLRHLLRQGEARLAVVVNEFGEVGIDGELIASCGFCPEEELEGRLVELANGCLCCTVQEEFLPTMLRLLERADQLDGIVVETSGLALPEPLVDAFRWPEIRGRCRVHAVVTVVDGEALALGHVVGDAEAVEAQRRADPSLDHLVAIEELFEDQLAAADLVLVSREDRLEPSAIASLRQRLTPHLRPGTAVLTIAHGVAPVELLIDRAQGAGGIASNHPAPLSDHGSPLKDASPHQPRHGWRHDRDGDPPQPEGDRTPAGAGEEPWPLVLDHAHDPDHRDQAHGHRDQAHGHRDTAHGHGDQAHDHHDPDHDPYHAHDPDHHDHHDHRHVAMRSLVVRRQGSWQREELEAQLRRLIQTQPVLRLKGRWQQSGKKRLLQIQAVGPRFDSWYEGDVGPDGTDQLELVLLTAEAHADQVSEALAEL